MYSKKQAKWPPQTAIPPAAASCYSLSPFTAAPIQHIRQAFYALCSVDIHASVRYSKICQSVFVRLCVYRKVYCGKTAEWVRMPFGMVSGVSQMMGVLDGVVIVEGEGAVLRVNLGRPTVTSGD